MTVKLYLDISSHLISSHSLARSLGQGLSTIAARCSLPHTPAAAHLRRMAERGRVFTGSIHTITCFAASIRALHIIRSLLSSIAYTSIHDTASKAS